MRFRFLFYLADRHQKSVSQIFNYPAWEIPYWQIYYSKEPSHAMRDQFLLSQLINATHHANFKDCKTKPGDFNYPNLWQAEEEKASNELVNQFSGVKGIKIHKVKP